MISVQSLKRRVKKLAASNRGLKFAFIQHGDNQDRAQLLENGYTIFAIGDMTSDTCNAVSATRVPHTATRVPPELDDMYEPLRDYPRAGELPIDHVAKPHGRIGGYRKHNPDDKVVMGPIRDRELAPPTAKPLGYHRGK